MKIKFWGVRGSIPTPGKNTVRYGGNTPCIEVNGKDGTLIILDSGTGIRPLGETLVSKSPLDINLFLTHTHWDHIHGFPFFIPAYIPHNTINMYGPAHFDKTLKQIMAQQMIYSYFPVRADELRANLTYRDLKEETLTIGKMKVRSKLMNHPVTAFGYRLEEGENCIVYTGDHEPYYNFLGTGESEADLEEIKTIIEEQNNSIVEFTKNADILIADSQYLEDEYAAKIGWGHSNIYQALDLAIKGKVKHLILFHHEPTRSDEKMDALVKAVKKKCRELKTELKVTAAKEGEEIILE